jgi:histone-lysine N-methyltransferase SETD2
MLTLIKVFPPVKFVLDKFRHKLPKDDLKRLGKDIAKKLVASDYKNNRVQDPTAKLTEKQERKIKTYVKDFLDRAVHKYESHKNETKDGHNGNNQDQTAQPRAPGSSTESPHDRNDAELTAAEGTMSDLDMDSPGSRKRKREGEGEGEGENVDSANATPSDGPDVKRIKEDDSFGAVASPPPPPPPPPADSATDDGALTEEQKALHEQEQALVRENEEAQRLEDEANNANGDGANMGEQGQSRKQEVLSH